MANTWEVRRPPLFAGLPSPGLWPSRYLKREFHALGSDTTHPNLHIPDQEVDRDRQCARHSFQKGLNEAFDLALSPENSKMSFTEDIGLKRKEQVKGFDVVLSVGQQTRVERPMHVLAKKDPEPFRFCHVHHRTGGVSGSVDRLYGPATQADFFAGMG